VRRIVIGILTIVSIVGISCEVFSTAGIAQGQGAALRLCTTNSNPPMEYADPANPTAAMPIGFDIDFAKAIAQQLKRSLTVQIFDFGGLIPAMQAKRCDMILAGMFATGQREQLVDFVRYMKAGTAFLVRKGNPKNIKGFGDLCGASAGYNVGSVYEQIIQDRSKACTGAGKPAIKGVLFQGDAGQIAALQNGQIDVAFRDSTAAKYIAQHASGLDVGGVEFGSDTFGLALPKGSDPLKAQLSEFVKRLQTDGTFTTWLNKWGLPADSAYCC
jgi:polar amino acid transport system substrate-binding protein